MERLAFEVPYALENFIRLQTTYLTPNEAFGACSSTTHHFVLWPNTLNTAIANAITATNRTYPNTNTYIWLTISFMLCFMLLQAFPKGSTLVPDVSRAILEVTEEEKMGEIEKAWIGLKKTCPDSSPSLSSNSLGLESFWGLFLIAGIASFSALTIYIAIFIYEHRDVLQRLDPNASTWRKLVVLGSQFNQKDLDSHTFRKAQQDKSCLNDTDRMGTEALPRGNYSTAPSTFSLQASPHTNCPPSPSSFSLQCPPSPSSFSLQASPHTNCPASPSTFSLLASPHTNCLPSPSSFSILSIVPEDQGNPAWEHGESNTNAQVAQEIMPGIELATQDQERERTSES